MYSMYVEVSRSARSHRTFGFWWSWWLLPSTGKQIKHVCPNFSVKKWDMCRISGQSFRARMVCSDGTQGLTLKTSVAGLKRAKRTLEVRRQCCVRTAVHPLHRRYCVDHLHLNQWQLNGGTGSLIRCFINTRLHVCTRIYWWKLHNRPPFGLESCAGLD